MINMPLFLAEHTWEKEKTPVIYKGSFNVMLQPEGFPETVKLCTSYVLPGERAICIWEADKAETLENMFKAMLDVFPAETKITPILQSYPPGPDLYVLMAQLMAMAK